MLGLIGKKVGMTRKFTDDGQSISVTVLEVTPATIVQVKTDDKDGYNAVQIVTGSRKLNRVTKPEAGHLSKAGTDSNKTLKEFRLSAEEIVNYSIGQQLSVELFNDTKFVDVQAKSKGKGFQGGVKRHNFRTQDASHGNSLSHRAIGSTGQNQTPGRVFKGKKMPGQMGNVQVTVQNLAVVEVVTGNPSAENKFEQCNYILLAGGVPGANGSEVVITPATKKIRSAA